MRSNYNTSEKVKQKIVKLVIYYLLESIGEPSSNISSTTSGSAYSDLFVLKGTSRDLLRNILLNAILPDLLGGLGAIFSGGRMSITMQVVSSLIPRGRVASWRKKITNQGSQIVEINQRNNMTFKENTCELITLTIRWAATSDENPREQSRAISQVKSSHTPSLAMIILPPALESWYKEQQHRVMNCSGHD